MNQNPISLIRKFKKYTYGEILISSITVSELEYGVAKSKYLQQNQQRLDEFLMPLNIIPYDEHAAKVYGKIRAQLEKKGQVIGPLDMLIAAHALRTMPKKENQSGDCCEYYAPGRKGVLFCSWL